MRQRQVPGAGRAIHRIPHIEGEDVEPEDPAAHPHHAGKQTNRPAQRDGTTIWPAGILPGLSQRHLGQRVRGKIKRPSRLAHAPSSLPRSLALFGQFVSWQCADQGWRKLFHPAEMPVKIKNGNNGDMRIALKTRSITPVIFIAAILLPASSIFPDGSSDQRNGNEIDIISIRSARTDHPRHPSSSLHDIAIIMSSSAS
jgi:hypothetical protein